MQLYSIKLRLSGDLFNEVRLEKVTAAQVTILKRLHGPDAVLDIKNTGSDHRTDEFERERLQGIYGKWIRKNEKIKSLDAILGVPGVPLPKAIPGVDLLPAPTTGKRAPKVAAPAVEETVTEEEFT